MSKKDHLLEIDELEVRYPAAGLFARLRGAEGFVTVLPGTSLAIERGTTVGLIGESGSGKTTLGRAVMGLAPISGGRIRLDRDTVTSRRDRLWPGMRRKTAFMFQDAVASLDPRMRLGLSVTEPLVVHRMLEGDRREKAIALLGLVGLSPDFADRYPHEISGGQARRVTVARALALEPELACIAAAVSPSTGIIDSHGLMLSYQGEMEACGGMIAFNTPLLRAEATGGGFLVTAGGDDFRLRTRVLVNAAGLHAQAVARRIDGLAAGTIPPGYYAKGCYFSLAGRAPFSRLVYPMPVKAGLGVHLTIDLGGQARFGPDAEYVDSLDYDVDPRRADSFYEAIRRYWPALPDGALQPGYAGIRPKLQAPGEDPKDFLIQGPADHGLPGLVNLYGIESPGLTASLDLADRVTAALD